MFHVLAKQRECILSSALLNTLEYAALTPPGPGNKIATVYSVTFLAIFHFSTIIYFIYLVISKDLKLLHHTVSCEVNRTSVHMQQYMCNRTSLNVQKKKEKKKHTELVASRPAL